MGMRGSVAVTVFMRVPLDMGMIVAMARSVGMHMNVLVLMTRSCFVMHIGTIDFDFTATAAAGCAHADLLYPTSSSLTLISVPPVTCT
jgi:hypothetical protein